MGKVSFFAMCFGFIWMTTINISFHNTNSPGIATDDKNGTDISSIDCESFKPILCVKNKPQPLSFTTTINSSNIRDNDILDLFLRSLNEPNTDISAAGTGKNTSFSEDLWGKSQSKDEEGKTIP